MATLAQMRSARTITFGSVGFASALTVVALGAWEAGVEAGASTGAGPFGVPAFAIVVGTVVVVVLVVVEMGAAPSVLDAGIVSNSVSSRSRAVMYRPGAFRWTSSRASSFSIWYDPE